MHFGAVQEYQGLKFHSEVRSDTNIAAVVGRNGAGKTRLLKGIAEGKVESARDLWRLQPLRRWSHEQVEQVLT